MAGDGKDPKVTETEPGVWVIGGDDKPAAGAAKPATNGNAGYGAREVPAAPYPANGADAAAGGAQATEGGERVDRDHDPTLVTLMFGSKKGEPSAEHFIVNFQKHLEPILKQMALDVGAKWSAAGGHTGTDENPQKVIGDPIMQQTSANEIFKDVFKAGFALECLEVMTGPPSPMILFKFRHVGQFNGKYLDEDGTIWEGKGQMIETDGMCHALKLPGMDVIQKIDVYYNHQKPIKTIADPENATTGSCPMSGKEGVCPLMR